VQQFSRSLFPCSSALLFLLDSRTPLDGAADAEHFRMPCDLVAKVPDIVEDRLELSRQFVDVSDRPTDVLIKLRIGGELGERAVGVVELLAELVQVLEYAVEVIGGRVQTPGDPFSVFLEVAGESVQFVKLRLASVMAPPIFLAFCRRRRGRGNFCMASLSAARTSLSPMTSLALSSAVFRT